MYLQYKTNHILINMLMKTRSSIII